LIVGGLAIASVGSLEMPPHDYGMARARDDQLIESGEIEGGEVLPCQSRNRTPMDSWRILQEMNLRSPLYGT
jgi:hypothetical protein